MFTNYTVVSKAHLTSDEAMFLDGEAIDPDPVKAKQKAYMMKGYIETAHAEPSPLPPCSQTLVPDANEQQDQDPAWTIQDNDVHSLHVGPGE